jgi:hypothetical protein
MLAPSHEANHHSAVTLGPAADSDVKKAAVLPVRLYFLLEIQTGYPVLSRYAKVCFRMSHRIPGKSDS